MDWLGVAKVLAAAIKTLPHDVVWFGKQGVGTDTRCSSRWSPSSSTTRTRTSSRSSSDGEGATVHREIEGAQEIVELPVRA